MTRPVFYFTRFFPAYRIPVLERLNDQLEGRLVVCSGQPPGTSSLNYLMKQQAHGFRQVSLKNRWLRGDKLHIQSFRKAFQAFGDPAVVLAEESPRSLSLPSLLNYARRRGAGRVLWGHFSSLNRAFDPKQHLRDRYRLALARRVEACACYTDGVADHLRSYLPDEKLFVARNTIDMETLFAQYDALQAEGKAIVRQRLGVSPDEPILFFMGRLVPEKGTELLLDTFAQLRTERPATLFIVGAGPEKEAMETHIAHKEIPNVHFLGTIPDEEVAPYLFASDVMLMPGYLGLIINHAFAFGLPVVSRKNPIGVQFHSPEVEYVQTGVTGILTEGNGAEDLVQAVKTVLKNQDQFSNKARFFARDHLTLDRMVDGLVGAIRYAEVARKNE